jgi:hypothetical protein
MQDEAMWVRRRIEAAEGLLAYEAPPDVVEGAKEFLAEVFENTEQHIDDRMDALKLMRKFEAPKIAQPTTRNVQREARDRKEAWREYEIGQRRHQYIKMARKLPPKGWDSDLRSDEYIPPSEGWPPTPDFTNLAEQLAEGRRRAALRVVEGGEKP